MGFEGTRVMAEGEYWIPMPEVKPPNVWNALRICQSMKYEF